MSDYEESDFPKTDIALIVEGKREHVNKEVLRTHSPVFKAMFEEDMQKSSEMVISDTTYADFKVFLQSFYPSMNLVIDENNVLQIISLASNYQIETLKDKCEVAMIGFVTFRENQTNTCIFGVQSRTRISDELLVKYILMADRLKLENLRQAAITTAAHLTDSYVSQKQDIFGSLTLQTRYDILKHRIKLIENDRGSKINQKYLRTYY